MRFVILIGCLLCIVPAGCAVRQIHKDHNQIRSALLDLYTDQIMDNLIRAKIGMPIIHLDYQNAQGMVTNTGGASFDDSQALTVPDSLTRQFVTTLTGGLKFETQNQITVNAVPVTTANEVYDAYLEYLSLDGSLVVSPQPPPPGAAHICRQRGNCYYWVPVEFGGDFFRLSLLTTAQRGQSLLKTESFFTRTVSAPGPAKADPQGFDDVQVLTVVLDSTVPNDSGYLEITGDKDKATGKQRRRDFIPYSETEAAGPSDTDRFELKIEAAELKALQKLLADNPAAKIYLRLKRPEPPTTDDLLQRANFQLQQVNQNLSRP